MRNRTIALIVLFSVLAGAMTLAAQTSTDVPHVLAKQDLPRVFLVKDFFSIAYSVCQSSDDMKNYFLSLVGIEPGTAAEDAFMRALEEARRLEFGESGPTRLVEENANYREVVEIKHAGPAAARPMTFEEIHRQELQEAGELAEIYRDLMKELEKAGSSIEGIDRYIETEMRGGMGVASSEPFDAEHPMWAISRAFEERLAQ